jgi:hypothetical protein
MAVERVGNWKRFSQHMEEYIRDHSVEKYGIENSSGFDLMSCNHFRGKWSRSLTFSTKSLMDMVQSALKGRV